jgi:hypothetical protein
LQRAPALLAAVLLLTAAAAVSAQTSRPAPAPKPVAPSSAASPDPKVNVQAGALAEFQANLHAYLELRESLAKKLKPLSPTANSAELATRQDALAAALKQARQGVKRGNLIPALAAKQIEQTIADDFKRRQAAATRAVFGEVPTGVRPVINQVFPDDAALATMPPLLLKNLPVLPDNLQYRLLQRDLVILDGDTRLIIDYIPNVLPAH